MGARISLAIFLKSGFSTHSASFLEGFALCYHIFTADLLYLCGVQLRSFKFSLILPDAAGCVVEPACDAARRLGPQCSLVVESPPRSSLLLGHPGNLLLLHLPRICGNWNGFFFPYCNPPGCCCSAGNSSSDAGWSCVEGEAVADQGCLLSSASRPA